MAGGAPPDHPRATRAVIRQGIKVNKVNKVNVNDLHIHILKYIQGGFSESDMEVMREEIEKLEPGDVYVEIGVDEGRSARVAHEYAKEGIFKIWIDIHDVVPHSLSIGRAPWMEHEGMVGIGKTGFYIHGDADQFAKLFDKPFVNLMFIDGHHGYDDVKKNTLMWEPLMKKGSTILFHDIDYPGGVPVWLDDHYGKGKWENCHGKIGRVRL